jgi:hypothetical protein
MRCVTAAFGAALALPVPALAQTPDPEDFPLSVAYCLGATEYSANSSFFQASPPCPPDAPPQVIPTCRAIEQADKVSRAAIQNRIMRLRAYLLTKLDDPRWTLGIPLAEKRGEADAAALLALAQSCTNSTWADPSACAETALRRAGPDAVTARDRLRRCDSVSAMLPF